MLNEPPKRVCAALVQLAIQRALGHMELEQTMARRQRHLVNETGVPGADHVTTAVGIGLQLVDELDDLVCRRPVWIGPRAPLIAIHRSQISMFIGPLVPNSNPIVLEVGNVGVAFQKPKQLVDDAAQMQFFAVNTESLHSNQTASGIQNTPTCRFPCGPRASPHFPRGGSAGPNTLACPENKRAGPQLRPIVNTR